MSCAACQGQCPTPEACEMPVAIVTMPPRAAFWLHRLIVRLHLRLVRWHLDCLIDERLHYQGIDCIGPMYLRNSFGQQRVLMARIRELEAQL